MLKAGLLAYGLNRFYFPSVTTSCSLPILRGQWLLGRRFHPITVAGPRRNCTGLPYCALEQCDEMASYNGEKNLSRFFFGFFLGKVKK